MNRVLSTLAVAAGALIGSAQAETVTGFSGDFAPGNWSTIVGANGALPSLDPAFFSVSSPEPAVGVTDFSRVYIGMTRPAKISFDWDYSSSDESAFWDPFGIVSADGEFFTQLTNDAGGLAQNGSFSVIVGSGDTFGFQLFAIEGPFGSATARIGNFSVEFLDGRVPEPPMLALLAIALLGGIAARRRASV